MSLKIKLSSSHSYDQTIKHVNQEFQEMLANPKKLPYLKSNPEESLINDFKTITNRLDGMPYYQKDATKEENAKILKDRSFVAIFFMFEGNHTTVSEKFEPIINRFQRVMLVKNKNIPNLLQNIKNLVAPSPVLYRISEDPKLVSTRNIPALDTFVQENRPVDVIKGSKAPNDTLSIINQEILKICETPLFSKEITCYLDYRMNRTKNANNKTVRSTMPTTQALLDQQANELYQKYPFIKLDDFKAAFDTLIEQLVYHYLTFEIAKH